MTIRQISQLGAVAFLAMALLAAIAPQASGQPPEDRPGRPAAIPGCERAQSRVPCEVPPPAPPGPPEWAGKRHEGHFPSDDEILAAETGVPLGQVQAHTAFVEEFNRAVNDHLLSSEQFAWFEVDTDFEATGIVRFVDSIPPRAAEVLAGLPVMMRSDAVLSFSEQGEVAANLGRSLEARGYGSFVVTPTPDSVHIHVAGAGAVGRLRAEVADLVASVVPDRAKERSRALSSSLEVTVEELCHHRKLL